MVCLLFVFFPLIYYIYVRNANILYRKLSKFFFGISLVAIPLISGFISLFLSGNCEWELSLLSRQMSLFFSFSAFIECLFVGIIVYDKRNTNISSIVAFFLFPIVQIIFLELIRFSVNRFHYKGMLIFLLGSLFGLIGDIFILHILVVKPSNERISVSEKEIKEALVVNREAYSLKEKEFAVIFDQKKEYKEVLSKILEESQKGNIPNAKAAVIKYTQKACDNHENAYCDNPYVNAMLCEKASVCESEGIQFVVSACIPKNIMANSVSLCSLFGNLLDNAINSCRVFGGQEKKIEIHTGIQGDYLMLFVDNSADDNSQKKDFSKKHYGLEIVRETVKENGGHFLNEYNKKEKVFRSEVAFLVGGEF